MNGWNSPGQSPTYMPTSPAPKKARFGSGDEGRLSVGSLPPPQLPTVNYSRPPPTYHQRSTFPQQAYVPGRPVASVSRDSSRAGTPRSGSRPASAGSTNGDRSIGTRPVSADYNYYVQQQQQQQIPVGALSGGTQRRPGHHSLGGLAPPVAPPPSSSSSSRAPTGGGDAPAAAPPQQQQQREEKAPEGYVAVRAAANEPSIFVGRSGLALFAQIEHVAQRGGVFNMMSALRTVVPTCLDEATALLVGTFHAVDAWARDDVLRAEAVSVVGHLDDVVAKVAVAFAKGQAPNPPGTKLSPERAIAQLECTARRLDHKLVAAGVWPADLKQKQNKNGFVVFVKTLTALHAIKQYQRQRSAAAAAGQQQHQQSAQVQTAQQQQQQHRQFASHHQYSGAHSNSQPTAVMMQQQQQQHLVASRGKKLGGEMARNQMQNSAPSSRPPEMMNVPPPAKFFPPQRASGKKKAGEESMSMVQPSPSNAGLVAPSAAAAAMGPSSSAAADGGVGLLNSAHDRRHLPAGGPVTGTRRPPPSSSAAVTAAARETRCHTPEKMSEMTREASLWVAREGGVSDQILSRLLWNLRLESMESSCLTMSDDLAHEDLKIGFSLPERSSSAQQQKQEADVKNNIPVSAPSPHPEPQRKLYEWKVEWYDFEAAVDNVYPALIGRFSCKPFVEDPPFFNKLQRASKKGGSLQVNASERQRFTQQFMAAANSPRKTWNLKWIQGLKARAEGWRRAAGLKAKDLDWDDVARVICAGVGVLARDDPANNAHWIFKKTMVRLEKEFRFTLRGGPAAAAPPPQAAVANAAAGGQQQTSGKILAVKQEQEDDIDDVEKLRRFMGGCSSEEGYLITLKREIRWTRQKRNSTT